MTTQDLSKEVLEVLQLQQNYFEQRKKGNPNAGEILNVCRKREAALKKLCKEILKPSQNQQSLF